MSSLLLLILVPWVVALVIQFGTAKSGKVLALGSTLATLILTGWMFAIYAPSVSFQYGVDIPWLAEIGSHFKLGADGLGMLMLLLNNLMLPFIVASSFSRDISRTKNYLTLILLMQGAMNGVFASLDGLVFYVFWELALLPIYFIVLNWGERERRIPITFKFFIYTLGGSLLMLLAFIFLWMGTGQLNSFDWFALTNVSLSEAEQGWVFWAFFLAFAIKMPVFPFHTWQPDTYTIAPPEGTMLLSGIMLKMGIYGVLRWLLPVVPLAAIQWGPIAIVLSVIGVVYGAWIAIGQSDLKRMFAYSSIGHVGLIAAGLFSMSVTGLQGSMFQMLSHGISVVGLFLCVQIIQRRMDTRQISSLGGIINSAPVFAALMLIVVLGSIGLPLTNGFIGEFLLIKGIFEYNPYLAGFAELTVILSAVYMLKSYQRSILGPQTPEFAKLTPSEAIPLVGVCVLIILFGIFPQPILDLTEPVARSLAQVLQANIFSAL